MWEFLAKNAFVLKIEQSLRDSWGSSNLSFMSFGHTNVEICNTSCLERNLQEVAI